MRQEQIGSPRSGLMLTLQVNLSRLESRLAGSSLGRGSESFRIGFEVSGGIDGLQVSEGLAMEIRRLSGF
jgi:hypothetical protein